VLDQSITVFLITWISLKIFDSSILNAGERFLLDSNELDIGSYEYMCVVHPWMVASIVIEEPVE